MASIATMSHLDVTVKAASCICRGSFWAFAKVSISYLGGGGSCQDSVQVLQISWQKSRGANKQLGRQIWQPENAASG